MTEPPRHGIHIVDGYIDAADADRIAHIHRRAVPQLTPHSNTIWAHPKYMPDDDARWLRHIADRVLAEKLSDGPRQLYCETVSVTAGRPGSYITWHADNTQHACPTHGINSSACPGTCTGSVFQPNHTSWRTHAAMVYAGEFAGGDITFNGGPGRATYSKVIAVQSGRLIVSPCSADHYHATSRVTSGTRYAVLMWFTDDPAHAIM